MHNSNNQDNNSGHINSDHSISFRKKVFKKSQLRSQKKKKKNNEM